MRRTALIVLATACLTIAGCKMAGSTITPATSSVTSDYKNTRPSTVTEDIVEIHIIPPKEHKK